MIKHDFPTDLYNTPCRKCGIRRKQIFINKFMAINDRNIDPEEIDTMFGCISDDEAIIKKIIE